MLRRPRFVAAALCALALACPAAASAGTLYSNNYSDKQIAALSFGGDGLLAPLAGSPFAVPDFLGGLAITPDGQRLIAPFYFNSQLGIYGLGVDGAPSQIGPLIPAEVTAAPAISPDGRFAYLGDRDGSGVRAYAIGADGSLTQVGDGFGTADGEGPALTPDGRFLLMPAYTGGSVERFAVQPDGSLVSLGTTPIAADDAIVVRVTPDGRFAVVLGGGLGVGSVESFAIGPDGSLTPTGLPQETGGASNGRAPALSPNGRFFYSANRNEDSISVYAIGPDGALAPVGAEVPTGLNAPDGLAISPSGRFLYAVESFGEFVQPFSVAADGTLTKLGGPIATGGESDGVGPVTRPAVPTARFAASAAAPGSASTFDATASSDAGATLTTYSWDFGDGTTLSGPDPKPQHNYAKAGVYEVTLTVGDDAGCTGFVYTGQTAYCNAKGAQRTVKIDTPPAITSLKVVRKRFGGRKAGGKAKAAASARRARRKPPKRLALRFKLTEKARVVFTIESMLRPCASGGTVNGIAISPPKCIRPSQVVIGTLVANGRQGLNFKRLPMRLRNGKPRGGKLLPGHRYRVNAVATDAAGSESPRTSTTFRIKRPLRR